jgi:hypothetical protein
MQKQEAEKQAYIVAGLLPAWEQKEEERKAKRMEKFRADPVKNEERLKRKREKSMDRRKLVEADPVAKTRQNCKIRLQRWGLEYCRNSVSESALQTKMAAETLKLQRETKATPEEAESFVHETVQYYRDKRDREQSQGRV